jgi:hypothetical protein
LIEREKNMAMEETQIERKEKKKWNVGLREL